MIFSVVIPMYNAEKYIYECVKSITNQSFKDFEIIIINDGSKDSSYEIVNNLADEDRRIRIINQENKGLFHSRIVGIENACGEYILFIDSDDKLKPNALERIYKEISNEHYDMIIYSAEFLYKNGKTKRFKPLFKNEMTFHGSSKQNLYMKILEGSTLNNMWIKAIKSTCFESEHLERLKKMPKITMGEDLLHSLFPITKARKIKYINEVLYQYRIIDSSMTRNFQPNIFESSKIVHLEIKKFLRDWDMNTELYLNLLHSRFLVYIGKIILFSPARINNMEDKFIEVLKKIYSDDFFIEAYNNAYKGLNILAKIPIILLIKSKFKSIITIKKVIPVIRKLLRF